MMGLDSPAPRPIVRAKCVCIDDLVASFQLYLEGSECLRKLSEHWTLRTVSEKHDEDA
jgi:hypothetical protein